MKMCAFHCVACAPLFTSLCLHCLRSNSFSHTMSLVVCYVCCFGVRATLCQVGSATLLHTCATDPGPAAVDKQWTLTLCELVWCYGKLQLQYCCSEARVCMTVKLKFASCGNDEFNFRQRSQWLPPVTLSLHAYRVRPCTREQQPFRERDAISHTVQRKTHSELIPRARKIEVESC